VTPADITTMVLVNVTPVVLVNVTMVDLAGDDLLLVPGLRGKTGPHFDSGELSGVGSTRKASGMAKRASGAGNGPSGDSGRV
jgi:hypothetical protein